MSLTVDAAPPGAPAVPSRGPSARSLPTGIAALFAALLTGKITADAATGTEGDAGAHGKSPPTGKDERRPPDPAAVPPDPIMLALLVPPQTAAVPQSADLTKTTDDKTTGNAMDTVLSAPAQSGTQNDGGLLFPPQTEQTTAQTPGLTEAAPAITPVVQNVTASVVTPAVQIVSTTAPAVTPAPASVGTPAAASAMLPSGKPLGIQANAVPAATSVSAGPAAPAVTSALTGTAPVMPALTSTGKDASTVPADPHATGPAVQMVNAVPVHQAVVPNPAQAVVVPQTAAETTPVPRAAKTDANPALKKSAAPANNTGRSLTAALPTGAATDAAGTRVAQAAAPSAADAHEPSRKAGTGPQASAVPAQASLLTVQTAHAASAKTQNTAARQVADEVVGLKLTPGAARQVTVNLHPREWGDVRVQITMAPANADGTAGAITAHLTADSPQARAALEASSGDLKRALHDAGLRLETLTISATDTVQAATQSAGVGNGSPGQDGSQNAFAAFAGTGNGQGSAASGGGQGGGNRPGGQSSPSFLGTADTDNSIVRPETPRSLPTKGVDIRA